MNSVNKLEIREHKLIHTLQRKPTRINSKFRCKYKEKARSKETENSWKHIKETILKVAKETCGTMNIN